MWYLVGLGGIFQSLMLLLLLDLGLCVCVCVCVPLQEFDYRSSKFPPQCFFKNIYMFHAQIMGVQRNSLFHVEMKKRTKGLLRSFNPCNSLSPKNKFNLHLSFFLCFKHRLWVSLEVSLNVEMKKGRNFEIIKPTFPFPPKTKFHLSFFNVSSIDYQDFTFLML